jgi:c-di-AMP phosphodiesterase-like protein
MIPCYVFIDSFNDAVSELTGIERNQILAETQNAIMSYFRANNINVELISYDRMLAVMNHKDYESLDIKNNRLNKTISKIGVSYNVDLSVSVGVDLTRTKFTYTRFDEAKEAAQLGQRRGGNQIIIKHNGTYNYIGGNNNPVEKSTDFVAKNFAKRISSFIEESENIYIFTHEQPDMDAFASGLILAKIIQLYEKNVKFVFDIKNASYDAKRALKTLKNDHSILIDRVDMRQVKNGINLAIVVDVNNPRNIFDFEHLNKFSRKIIIDHHIQKEETVNASVEYIEVASSSVIEMVIEMMDYFKYELKMTPYQATYALAALMVDTKNYQVKTTSKTFSIASLLRRKGARIDIANNWLNDDLKYMKYINERVNEAILYDEKIAVVEINNFADRAIISKIADRLITSNEVEAGFVLNNYRGVLSISARSKGKINVEQIMAEFNGGGHATMAATKIQIGRNGNDNIIQKIVLLAEKQMEE